ncbi:Glycosyl transferase, family 2 domain protein, partial [mine drainage metagenome]
NLNLDLEIIIIDDNSPDGTFEVATELASKYGNIKTLKRPGKMGLASAISDGLRLASGKYVAVMDADLQHPPETLAKMIEEAKKGK